MKLLFFSKYPPLVGGVSVSVYWKTYLLALSGAEIFIVSNAPQASAQHKSIITQHDASKNINIFFLSDDEELRHIPHSKSYATRLVSLGCEIVKKNSIDLIEAFYLEPYGLVAATISEWFNIPYGLKHAGSDLGKLMLGSEYQPAFIQLLRKSDYIITGVNKIKKMHSIGVSPHALVEDCFIYPVKEYFNPFGEKLDINYYVKKFSEVNLQQLPAADVYQELARKYVDISLPIIGVYGKASHFKGHHELIKALASLKKMGYPFNLLLMTQGYAHYIHDLSQCIIENNLMDNVMLLPFVPTWEVSKFIRACDAVCYLENNFPIQGHNTTKIPLEILTCGRHLIISSEAFNNSFTLKNIPQLVEYCTIVTMNHPDSLSNALEKFFKNSRELSCRAIQFYEKNFLSADFETQAQARRIGNYYEKLSEKATLNFRLKKLRYLQQSPDILFASDVLTTSINQLNRDQFLNFLPSLLPNGHRFIPVVLISKLVEEGLCLEISTPRSLGKFLEELLIHLNTLKLNHPALTELLRYEVLTYQLKHLTEKKHYSAKDLNLSTLSSLKIFFPSNVSWFHDQYDIISKLNTVADFNDFNAYQLLGDTKHYLVQYDFEAKKTKNFLIEGYGLKYLKAIKQSCNVSELFDESEVQDDQVAILMNMLNELSCRKLVVFE